MNETRFGMHVHRPLDGYVYAQPLYVPKVSIPGQGTHNVVFVATEHDSVYAFDADAASPSLWHASFIDPASGITAVPEPLSAAPISRPSSASRRRPSSTPLRERSTSITKVKLGPDHYPHQLHALDITTGRDRMDSPVTIPATVPALERELPRKVTFDPISS